MEHWDEGVYVFRSKGEQDATPLIVSAGVHGDETAPAAIVEQLCQDLEQRRLIPRRACLLILANPPALLERKRFLRVNMNRLFGAPVRPPGYEGQRSLTLEQHCREFAELYGIGWHLDLHATIKPSLHEHFALMPACVRDYDDSWAPLLAAHGVSALVKQKSPAHTFSHFTCAQLGYESFTLECGAVGADAQTLKGVLTPLLRALLEDAPFSQRPAAALQRYRVIQDLRKTSADFRFLVDERCANFTRFAAGTPLAQDGDHCIDVPRDDCALLFANSAVPVGDRAGLLLQPC